MPKSHKRKTPDGKIANFMRDSKLGRRGERAGVMLIGEGCFGVGVARESRLVDGVCVGWGVRMCGLCVVKAG